MPFMQTEMPGVFIIEPRVFGDKRGYFFESYNEKLFISETGLDIRFVQDNQSSSSKGVLRGLHFQKPPHTQSKLVRVLSGSIFDVIVDFRKGSPAYLKWFGIELSAENKKQIFIPKGFAHGFLVLTESAEIYYKCDDFYHPESDSGIRWDDPDIGIKWNWEPDQFIISDKDQRLLTSRELGDIFQYGENL